jgi:uncharacterized protein YjbI with pentapeptide repeats
VGLTDRIYEDRTFTGTAGGNVARCSFSGCSFRNVEAADVAVQSTRFVECRFLDCDLSLVRLTDTTITGCRFEGCRISGVDWTRARWPKHTVAGANRFVRCDLSSSTFSGIHLGSIVMRECRLGGSTFREASLPGADLSDSEAAGADFSGADLRRTRLVGVRDLVVDPSTCRLEGAVVDAGTALVVLEALGLVIEAADAGPGERRAPIGRP